MKQKTLVSIVGPTAVGKTSTAIQIAKAFDAEIISSDSRQFFKEINIGTATPEPEELAQVPHHFINNLSITEEYNASKFEKEVLGFLNDYFKEKDIAIMCGGSGMYVDAIIKGFDTEVPTANESLRKELNEKFKEEGIEYLRNRLLELDPVAYGTIDIFNSKRLLRAIEICLITGKTNAQIKKGFVKERDFNIIQIGLDLPRPQLYDRINQRVDVMLKVGLLDEVKSVSAYTNVNALKTFGYKEIFDFLDGETSWELCVEKIKTNSRRYAKRQLTWFKRNEKTQWFSPSEINKISLYIRNIIEKP